MSCKSLINMNLNNKMKVKISEKGYQHIYDMTHPSVVDSVKDLYCVLKEDEDGYIEIQVFDVMHYFGNLVYGSLDDYIEFNAKIEVDGNYIEMKQ